MTRRTRVVQRGRCRWCGCTWTRPCLGGCSWGNAQETLCSECVEVDRLIRSRAGRQELAMIVNDYRFRVARALER